MKLPQLALYFDNWPKQNVGLCTLITKVGASWQV